MNRTTIGFALFLAGLGCSGFSQEPGFLFYKDLRVPDLEQDELVAVQPDEAVYRATSDDLRDLRIFTAEGTPVPFLLRRSQTTRARTVRETWTADKPSARPLDGDGLEISIQLDEDDPLPDGLTVVSPLRDFEHRIRVYSSADGNEWKPLGSETVIFDYSRFMDVRSDSIAFPTTEDRHFRIVIDAVTSLQESQLLELTRRLRGSEETNREETITVDRRPFRIERIEFWREELQQRSTGDEKTAYTVSEMRIEDDSEEQRTLIFVDSPRAPLTSFQLQTSSRNFSRRVEVAYEEQQGSRSNWRTLSSGVLSRIDFRDLQRQELEIAFPESRRQSYRLAVENRDSPPLAITGLQSEGNVYRLLFLASPGTSYQMAYGSEKVESPQFDTATIQAALAAGFSPTLAELGEQQSFVGPVSRTTWLDWLRDPKVLVGLIVVLVVVLGLSLYSATQRLDDLNSARQAGEDAPD